MRTILFLYLLVCFPFSVHIYAAEDTLPSWIFEEHKGLYLGVSEVMDDAGLALLQAQARAVLNYCLTEGIPFESSTISTLNAEGEKTTTKRLEAIRLELSGFECTLEKLYAHSSGEYFVLCRVKQGKSNNKIIFNRDFDKSNHYGIDSCWVSSRITTTLEHHSYSESVIYNKNKGMEEVTVKVEDDVISGNANYRYADYTSRVKKEKIALKFSYNLQHSFGRAWIGALTQIPLCNKEVSVKSTISSTFKESKEDIESIINSSSSLIGKSEGLPFPLICIGITKGKLIMEAGIYGIVEKDIADQICTTTFGEYKDGISACSDALTNALIDSAMSTTSVISSKIESVIENGKPQNDNNSMENVNASTTLSSNVLKNFQIKWQQLPEGIICICTCPIPKLEKKKEVLP